jgi:hypothetical protein
MVLSTLAELGAKFSCQNKVQLEQLSKIGVPSEDIFFGSSVKVQNVISYILLLLKLQGHYSGGQKARVLLYTTVERLAILKTL